MRKHPREIPAVAPIPSLYLRAASIVLCAGIVAVSTLISLRGMDSFRLAKEIAMRAEAILLVGLGVFAATARDGRWRDLVRGIPRRELLLCAAILGWTLVTTAVSTNRLISIDSTITVAAAIVVFVATRRLAKQISWTLLDLCFAVAVLNSVLIVLQEYDVWNPFTFDEAFAGHVRSSALIGNPNDVGSYLVAPMVLALVGSWILRGRRQWVSIAVAIAISAGLVASLTRGALVAVLAAAIAFALNRPWKQSVAALGVIVAVVAAGFAALPQLRERFTTLVTAAEERQYEVLFSERLAPFLTAVDMFRSHPLTGVGPGCFKYNYMDERMALAAYYPAAWTRGWPENWEQTHNDHLQIAAEAGLPGYALLLAAIVLVARRSDRRVEGPDNSRHRFARAVRIPLATAFFAVALAEFPLQIAAPRAMFLTIAALTLGWDTADE